MIRKIAEIIVGAILFGSFAFKANTTKAQDARVEVYLSSINQTLDTYYNSLQGAINTGDKASYQAFSQNNCILTLVIRNNLQQAIISGQISPNSRALINIGKKIKYLRQISNCNEI
jgi:hypothetical protein